MIISCEEAAHICNKAQYKESGFLEILKLRFHILYCKTCARFSQENTVLTTLCKKADLKTLSDLEKQQMKARLEKYIY